MVMMIVGYDRHILEHKCKYLATTTFLHSRLPQQISAFILFQAPALIVPKNTRTCASTCGCAECARTRTHAHAKILKHAHAHARAREYFFKMRTRTHAHAIENFAHVRARARFIKLSFFGQLGHFSTSLF
jgi:hypothetical protein